MALIDVTDLLSDPDLVDPMKIIHRASVVNEMGQNILSEQSTNTIGSIQPVSGKTLLRVPEELRIMDIKSFWVRGKIISDGRCQYPDILSFRNDRYAVQTILDWTNFGGGWSEGICIREVAAK